MADRSLNVEFNSVQPTDGGLKFVSFKFGEIDSPFARTLALDYFSPALDYFLPSQPGLTLLSRPGDSATREASGGRSIKAACICWGGDRAHCWAQDRGRAGLL